jgi:hypothetical protein
MKRTLAGSMFLVFLLGLAPSSIAMGKAPGTSQGPAHRCCLRLHSQIMLQLAPVTRPCGPQHRCCFSSEHPATLPVTSPAPRNDLTAATSAHADALLARSRVISAFEPSTLLFRSLLNVILRI